MLVPDDRRTHARQRLGRGIAITASSLALGVGIASPGAAGAVTSSDGTVVVSAGAATTPFNAKVLSARAGLTTAVTKLTNHQDTASVTALRTLRVRLANVHQAAMTLMGPGRVLSTFNLEHQVAMKLLPAFNGLTRSTVVNAVQTTLWTTFAGRTALLTKVAALPGEEGVGGDYDDGESDTLPIYTTEVNAYAAARTQFRLTVQGRNALTRDLAQVRATRLQFTRRFGGGE